MPIFECVTGKDTPARLVKASSAAVARRHLVTAKAISAERMSELLDADVKLETAAEPAVGEGGGE